MPEESREQTSHAAVTRQCDATVAPEEQNERGALIALLRLLTREPPAGHDFKTCPICKRHGIERI